MSTCATTTLDRRRISATTERVETARVRRVPASHRRRPIRTLPRPGALVMNIAKKTVVPILTLASLVAGLCACGLDGDTPGQTLDRGLNKAGDAVKEAGEAIKPK